MGGAQRCSQPDPQNGSAFLAFARRGRRPGRWRGLFARGALPCDCLNFSLVNSQASSFSSLPPLTGFVSLAASASRDSVFLALRTLPGKKRRTMT